MNGLPIFGSSIGVTYRGVPVAGAMAIPWPSAEGMSECSTPPTGRGARIDGKEWSIPDSGGSESGGTGDVAGVLSAHDIRFRKGMRGHTGDVRVSGSVVYELAMATLGVFRYSLLAAPRVWDVAAGAVIVPEAGGSVLVSQGGGPGWGPLTHVGPSWNNVDGGREGSPSVKELRAWAKPIIVGRKDAVEAVAANLYVRRSLGMRVRRAVRRMLNVRSRG